MATTKTATTEFATGEFDNINAALSAFQSTIPVPVKDATADTGKYGYSYSSLDVLVPLIFPRLAAVGLAYTAVPHVREDGIFVLRASLKHVSGQEITGDYPLGSPTAPAQAIGSALSYARRYALLALTGVAPTGEDDDGAAASKNTAEAPARPAAAAPSPDSAAGLKAQMADVMNAEGSKVTGEDANNIMGKLAEGKSPGQWAVPELKKGLVELKKLDADRREGK